MKELMPDKVSETKVEVTREQFDQFRLRLATDQINDAGNAIGMHQEMIGRLGLLAVSGNVQSNEDDKDAIVKNGVSLIIAGATTQHDLANLAATIFTHVYKQLHGVEKFAMYHFILDFLHNDSGLSSCPKMGASSDEDIEGLADLLLSMLMDQKKEYRQEGKE